VGGEYNKCRGWRGLFTRGMGVAPVVDLQNAGGYAGTGNISTNPKFIGQAAVGREKMFNST